MSGDLTRFWLYFRHNRDPVGTAVPGTVRSYVVLSQEKGALVERWRRELEQAFGADNHGDLLHLLRRRHGATYLWAELSTEQPEDGGR